MANDIKQKKKAAKAATEKFNQSMADQNMVRRWVWCVDDKDEIKRVRDYATKRAKQFKAQELLK